MDKLCNFSRIPTEVLCMIVSYLPEDEKIAFKLAYPHFFCQHRHINVRESFACSTESIRKILILHCNPDVVTELDFNYCYFMSSKEISCFTKQCKNVKELSVAHSNLSIRDLTEILRDNFKISKLCFNICDLDDFWLTEETGLNGSSSHKLDLLSTQSSWKNLLLRSEFGKCLKTLKQLLSLDLHIGQEPVVLGTILSGCENLENFCLRVNLEEEKGCSILGDLTANSIEDFCSHPPLCKLKSIVLLQSRSSNSKRLNSSMESFIQKLVEQGSSYLKSLWSALPGLSVCDPVSNIKNLIAWKEINSFGNFMPPRMPTMESFACNKYMQAGDFHSPQMKQIECGFWKDNFKSFCRAHPALERVRFNKRPCEVSELYSIIDWSPLPRIKVISLHPRIIYASDYLQNSWMRNRAERALCMLLKACPTLAELEICPDSIEKPDPFLRNSQDTFITADSLCGLSVCPSLRNFSLNSVTISYKRSEINETSFLEEIVTKCPNLESFSIQELNINLTNRGLMERNRTVLDTLYNDCIERCCLALRSAPKLRFLRLKMRVVSQSFDQLIRLLTYCPSIIQLGLIATSVRQKLDMFSWDEAEFTALFVDLVQHLPKLIALLVVLPGAPISHCRAATTALETIFRPLRPCFCVQITDSLESSNPPSLPLVHSEALARDLNPSVGELPFHLTTSVSHY